MTRRLITLLALVGLVALTPPARAEAQEAGLLTGPVSVSGSVNVTTKGISNVPALTLGRPAAIVDLAVRKGRLGFEPQLRFDLEGKPWSFLLWGRYRVVEGDNFRLTLGAHPSFSFRTVRASLVADGVERDLIQVRRYVAGDAASSWRLSETVTTGGYYLYSHGLDFGAPTHTHMAAARTTISGELPAAGWRAQVTPQVYFLRTGGQNGTYVSSGVSMTPPGSPVTIGAFVNAPIVSEVTGGQDVLWNVSLTYTFP